VIGLILTLAFVGLIVWLIVTYVPMAQPFKTVIMVIAAICVIFALMSAFGIVDIPIPRLR